MALLPLLLSLAALAVSRGPAELRDRTAVVIDLFYDLRFEEAERAAEALAREEEGHPAGPFYLSVVSYQRLVAQGGRRPEVLERFFELSAQAAAAAERLLPAAEGHYYLGAARGFRARALAGTGRYLRALPEAVSAVRHLRAALDLDPGLEEAYLGLGMYDYYAQRLPLGAKPFAYLLTGVWGDRERGLRLLERAAGKGGPARMEARAALAAIYCREDEALWAKAEALLAELMARYPRNPAYRLRRVYAAQRRGDWDLAARLADPRGRWTGLLDASYRDAVLARARYRTAESHLLAGRPEEASPHLEALEASGVPADLRDWAALRRANLLHALGRDPEAEAAYLRVREGEPGRLARRFRERPFPEGPKGVRPFRWLDAPR